MVEQLDLNGVPPVPWSNGAGTTRLLATAEDAQGRLLWRISVADLAIDAEFSHFVGIDRLFVALGKVTLTVDGVVEDVEPWGQVRFPGEASTAVAVAEPTQALNVMTGRDLCTVVVRGSAVDDPVPDGADFSLCLGDRRADVLLTRLPEAS